MPETPEPVHRIQQELVQTMDTAPKDGTPILVSNRTKTSFAKVRWYAKSEMWILAVPSDDYIEQVDFEPRFWKHLSYA